jgi:Flp pilus assembly protein TadD/predicted aspartyl protease
MKSVYFPKRMFFIPFHLRRSCNIILILLTFAFFSAVFAEDIQQVSGEDSRKLVKQAKKLTRKGKLPEAETILRRALEINPGSSDAKLNLAHLLVKQRRLLEAYDLSFNVAKNEPKNAFAYAVLGITLLNAGNFREAERAIVLALKLDHKESLAWAGLGMLDFYENRVFQSLDSLRAAAYQEPEEPDYFFALGQVCARAERYKEAADAYRRYLTISNDSDAERRDRIKGLIDFLNYLGNQQSLYDVGNAERTRVNFDLIGNRPVINVKVNGKDEPLRFVLDTGSGISVISDKTAQRLNIKSVARGGKARGIGGDGKFEIVYGFLRSVNVGDVKIKNVPVYIRQFHKSNEEIDGYIGLSLISKFLTTIDYGNLTFDLERKDSMAKNERSAEKLSLPLRLTSSGFLSGEVQLEGIQVPLNFIVDTGASVSVISNQLANTGEMGQFIKDEKMRVIGSAGVTENVQSYLLPRVTFGTHSRESITAIRLDLDIINETSGFEQAGILGGNFLKNYRLTFDFENSKVIFVPINK